MIIALDFDQTYTLDPPAWDAFIKEMSFWDATIHIVTVRHEYWDAHPLLDRLEDEFNLKVFFTDGRAKKEFMEGLGIKIDVWIDDRPQTITSNSSWPHESAELRAWREENYKTLTEQGFPEYARDLSKYDLKNSWQAA
jgi:hypothetical protein